MNRIDLLSGSMDGMTHLHAYRRSSGMKQYTVAARMNVQQSRVSQLEHYPVENMRIDTLRRYVEAIGGRLTLVAEFPEED